MVAPLQLGTRTIGGLTSGIAREDQSLIFEKFGRADVRNGKPGTGLGLFISRAFAEAHGGTLLVDSLPGEGATFTLTLPLGESA